MTTATALQNPSLILDRQGRSSHGREDWIRSSAALVKAKSEAHVGLTRCMSRNQAGERTPSQPQLDAESGEPSPPSIPTILFPFRLRSRASPGTIGASELRNSANVTTLEHERCPQNDGSGCRSPRSTSSPQRLGFHFSNVHSVSRRR